MKKNVLFFVIWAALVILPVSAILSAIWTESVRDVLIINTIVCLYVLVAIMALDRKRNAVAWVLLRLILTPLAPILLLLILGDNGNLGDDAEKLRYYGDEE